MQDNILNKIRGLLSKTNARSVVQAEFFNKDGRRQYPTKLRQLLSAITIRRYHDTTLFLDNDQNRQIKPLLNPILSGERLKYEDACLEICNYDFNTIQQALKSIVDQDTPNKDINSLIPKSTFVWMYETCQIIATLLLLIKLIKNDEFKKWKRVEMLSH